MKRILITMIFVLGIAIPVHASLVDRGGGLIYDTDLNITWQKNANLAATQTFGVSGIDASGWMNWGTANNWIAAMNNANYLGYHDWRLPQLFIDEVGYKKSSEMGHLWYDELHGTSAAYPANWGPFINLPNDLWTSNTVSLNNPNMAGTFVFGRAQTPGYQGRGWKDNMDNPNRDHYSAWAVRTGDSAPVPIPPTILLLGSGLLGVVGLRRKFKKE